MNNQRSYVRGEAHALFLLGGALQHSTMVADSLGYDAVVYLDAASELEHVKAQPGVIEVCMAQGETVQTLLESDCFNGYEDLVDDVCALLRDRPGVSLQDGMGQVPAIGFLAAIKLVSQPGFQEVLDRVLDELMFKHNAVLRRVTTTVGGGGGGGTAAGGSEVIARAVTGFFLSETSAVVDSEVIRVGGLSYTGLSRRIAVNAGGTFVRDVERLREDRHPRQSNSLVLTEFPMCAERRELRGQFGAQFLQAFNAKATRAEIKLFKPNQATASSLGSVTVVRPKYLKTIPELRVAGMVANIFLGRLKYLAEASPSGDEVRRVDMNAKRTPGTALTPDLIAELANAADIRPANFVETCTRAVAEYETHIQAELADGTTVAALRPGQSFQVSYDTTDFSRKLSACRELQQRLERMRDEKLEECEGAPTRATRIEMIRENRQAAVKRVKSAVNGIFPQSMLAKLRAFLVNPQSTLDELRDSVVRFQEIDDELRRLDAEQTAITRAWDAVAREAATERQRLEQVKDVLRPHSLRQKLGQADLLVTVGSIDRVLRELLGMSMQNASPEISENRIAGLLTKCVESVTLAGLAEITGATKPNPEDIAWILAYGKPSYEAPVWGATDPLTDGTTLVVLPPVDRKLEDSIRQSLAAMAPDKILVSSDTAQGGVNIVYLQIWKPTRMSDVCDQYLTNKITAASNRISMPTGDAQVVLSAVQSGSGNGKI